MRAIGRRSSRWTLGRRCDRFSRQRSAVAGRARPVEAGGHRRRAPADSPPPPPVDSSPGTWRLDAAASRITDGAGLAGLIAAGAPPTIHVTQPANGTLVVESAINEGHARLYRPGGKTATPVAQGGDITMTSRWAGTTLVAEGTTTAANGAAVNVKESYSTRADADDPVDRRLVTGPDGAPKVSQLKYTPIADMGPCEKWATPCKR